MPCYTQRGFFSPNMAQGSNLLPGPRLQPGLIKYSRAADLNQILLTTLIGISLFTYGLAL
jgi:hypothetical protein